MACTDTGGGTSYFRIGSYKLSGWPGGSDGYFAGKIDEVRFSNTARSADWIATESNQNSPSTFYSVGSAVSSGPIISNLSTSAGDIGSTLTITGTGFGSTQGSSTLTFNGTSATASSWSATSIGVTVPVGATTGNVLVTAASVPSNGVLFTVTGGSWSNGYTYRRAITIDHTKVPNSDQNSFPFLFSGTYSYLAGTGNGGLVTNASGYDVVFAADASGTTMLPFEQASYSATGSVQYWVKVPTVSHTYDTVIYMFYGNSSITTDQSNKTGTWDSNYKGVWHLPNGTTLSANDSTANANNGTVSGATATNGVIDGAANFTATTQKIDVGNPSSLQITSNAITLEAWVKTSESNPSYWEKVIAKEITNNVNPYTAFTIQRCGGTNEVGVAISTGGSGTQVGVCSVSSLSLGSWTHVVGTYDGSQLRIYLNGALDNHVLASGNIVSTTTDVVFGTDTFLAGETLNGSLDELRISDTPRGARLDRHGVQQSELPPCVLRRGEPCCPEPICAIRPLRRLDHCNGKELRRKSRF